MSHYLERIIPFNSDEYLCVSVSNYDRLNPNVYVEGTTDKFFARVCNIKNDETKDIEAYLRIGEGQKIQEILSSGTEFLYQVGNVVNRFDTVKKTVAKLGEVGDKCQIVAADIPNNQLVLRDTSNPQSYFFYDISDALKLVSELDVFYAAEAEICSCEGKWYVAMPDSGCDKHGLVTYDPFTKTVENLHSFKKKIQTMISDQAGGSIIIGLYGAEINIYDVKTGNVKRIVPHTLADRYSCLMNEVSEDGVWLASLEYDFDRVLITDLRTYRTKRYAKVGRMASFCVMKNQFLVLHGGNVSSCLLSQAGSDESWFVSDPKSKEYLKPFKFNKKITLEENIVSCGLGGNLEKMLNYWSQPYRMSFKKAGRKSLERGASKISGQPDLVSVEGWPLWETKPMAFIAQINLDELSTQFPSNKLPQKGLLSFFIGVDKELEIPHVNGTPDERNKWKVIYSPDVDKTERIVMVDEPEFGLECSVKFQERGDKLPLVGSLPVKALGLSDKELDNYFQLAAQINTGSNLGDTYDQLLGYPQFIQENNMEAICELSINGRDSAAELAGNSDIDSSLLQSASDWTLLLQLSSSEKTDLMWGDGGVLYWYIRRSDLDNENFDNTWIVLQN